MLNKIYNENCLDTFARLGEKSVDVIFTSPPYNRKRNDKYEFYDDTVSDYFEMLNTIVELSLKTAKKYTFINIMKNYYNSSEVYRIFGKFHNEISEVFVWEKSNPLPASGFAITNAFEYIICFGEKGLKSNTTYTKNHLTTSVTPMPENHKAVMHTDVARFFIENFTNENDLVYDPFMGTGTTALVCRENNRNYIGSEIVKEYCDLAEKRLQSYEKKLKGRLF